MRFLPIQYLEQLAGKAEPDKIRSVGSRNVTKIAVIKALSVANACAGSIKGKSGSGQKRRNRSIRQKAQCLTGRLHKKQLPRRDLCSVCNSAKLHLIAQNLRKKNFLSCCQRSINEKSGRYL